MSSALELVNNLLEFIETQQSQSRSVNQSTTHPVLESRYQTMTEEEKRQGPLAIYSKNKYAKELCETANKIGTRGKGILAADESTGTIGKRLSSINVENNETNRRTYRGLLFSTDGLEKYISGVILYDETIKQSNDKGVPFPKVLSDKGIIPGIKVDLGAKPMPGCPGDTYTQGLTDLHLRAPEYYKLGARFAKWRAVLRIQNGYISQASIQENAWTLARYARICQEAGLAPIVEPEILMDGDHSIEVCQYWTEKTLSACYKALVDQEVLLEGTMLKPNMVLPGNSWKGKRSVKQNAQCTIQALKRTVPCAVPSINFLSGGQSEEEATRNLDAMNRLGPHPWTVSFSYGRALQQSCLKAWLGKTENLKAGQDALMVRGKANSMAQLGKYDGFAENEESKNSLFVKGYVY